MPIEFHIHPDPLIVAEDLDNMARQIETDEGPMGSSLDILIASVDRSFMEEGPGWEPWSETYVNSIGSSHGPLLGQETILIRTAELIGAATDPANYSVTHDAISWTGSASPEYTDYHLEGTSKMPERSFLHVDATAQEEILAVWTKWLDGIVDRAAALVSYRGGAFRDVRGRFARRP